MSQEIVRTFRLHNPLLQAVARAERDGNPILIADDWVKLKSFTFNKQEKKVVVVFEKVNVSAYSADEAEALLRNALRNI